MENRIKELEEALLFYAESKNYDSRFGLAIFKDSGDKARKVLRNSRRNKMWSDYELQYLLDNYPAKTAIEIGEDLGRSVSGVRRQTEWLGLKKERTEFVIYKKGEAVVEGSAKECAEYLGVSQKYIYYLASPAHEKRVSKFKDPENATIAVRL